MNGKKHPNEVRNMVRLENSMKICGYGNMKTRGKVERARMINRMMREKNKMINPHN